MGDKSVETLGSKIRFSSVLKIFPLFPQCVFFYFLFLVLTVATVVFLTSGKIIFTKATKCVVRSDSLLNS